MSKSIVIRRALHADAGAMKRVDDELFAPPDRFSLRRYRYLLLSTRAITYVAERGADVIGSVISLVRRSRSGRISGRVYSLAVATSEQHNGVGAALLSTIERELQKRGVWRIYLETRVRRGGARRFFERHGYNVVAIVANYYHDSDGFKMAKTVRAA